PSTCLPSSKKVACTPYFLSISRILGVYLTLGPSSKVSATRRRSADPLVIRDPAGDVQPIGILPLVGVPPLGLWLRSIEDAVASALWSTAWPPTLTIAACLAAWFAAAISSGDDASAA